MKTVAVQIDKHAFYLGSDGCIHQYKAQSRTYNPDKDICYLEDDNGHRKPMREGLWGGIPGEFVPWRIRQWKREAREAYEILSELPPNFVFELM